MKINIDEKALEYIKKKSKENTITVDLYQPNHCWVSVVEPSVQMEKPKDLNPFLHLDTDGISVYYSKLIASNNKEIDIVLRKYFGMKYLKAENVNID